jgi:hypothetical protein
MERNTVPIGQDQRKIILKLNAKILGILYFSKEIFNTRKIEYWKIFYE